MKLKQTPRDFRVFEDLEFEPDPKGAYYVHKLVKEKLSTLEALDRICREARVPRTAIAYAGLKDRQAITQQFISIENQKVGIRGGDLKVSFVGRSGGKITSKLSAGNRFQVVVRDLNPRDLSTLDRNTAAICASGLPNYFDDQRFGCLVQGQGLVVRSLALGKAESALKQLIATPPQEPRRGDARLRRLLHDRWGDWEVCRDIGRGPMYEAIFKHLVRHPTDFLGALDLVPQRQKLIHLFAFQSFLWNRAVSRYLARASDRRDQLRLPSACGELVYWTSAPHTALTDDAEFPLLDHRTRLQDPTYRLAVQETLKEQRLRQEQLQIDADGFRLVEEPRRLVLRPADLKVAGPWPDERNKGRLKVELRFKLPRGAYATLVVKRLFARVRRDVGRSPPPPEAQAAEPEPRTPRGQPKFPERSRPQARPSKRRASVLRRIQKRR